MRIGGLLIFFGLASGLEKLFQFARAAFDMDRNAAVFGCARRGAMAQVKSAGLRVFDYRRIFKREMRRPSAFI